MLLLGNSETIGNPDGRFEVISKSDRLYRRTAAAARPAELGFSMSPVMVCESPRVRRKVQAPSRHAALADLCQRLVMENLRAGGRSDQPEVRVSILPGTDRYMA